MLEDEEDAAQDVTRDVTPPWSAEDVETRLNDALNASWPSPSRIKDAYLTAMSYGDTTCPGSRKEMTDPITAMQGCTASSGWSYQGHATYSETGTIGEDNMANWWVSADFEIQNPNGEALIGGGGVMVNYLQAPSGGSEYTVELYGTWQDESQTDWLGDGISAVLTTHVTGTASTHQVSLDGGLTIHSNSLHFRDLNLNADDCDGPQGEVGIHDQAGSWYWAAFECNSCGSLSHGTTDMGDVCIGEHDLAQTIFDAVSQP